MFLRAQPTSFCPFSCPLPPTPLLLLCSLTSPSYPVPWDQDQGPWLAGFSKDGKLRPTSVSLHEPTQTLCLILFKSSPWYPGWARLLALWDSQSNKETGHQT